MPIEAPTILAPNQQAALIAPCRKCGNRTVKEMSGPFGPWVLCTHCKDKVRRPRGIHALRDNGGEREPLPFTPKPETQPESQQGANGGIEAAILKLVQPQIDKALGTVEVDASEVLATVKQDTDKVVEALRQEIQTKVNELAASRPVVVEVKQVDKPVITLTDVHYMVPRVIKLLGAGIPVFLYGAPGTGKTTGLLHAAKGLGRKAEIDTWDPSTMRSMLQGYRAPDGTPVHTALTRCVTEGKMFIADECDNAPAHVQTLCNSGLANGHWPLAWGSVETHPDFSFSGTGNTPMRPTRAFPDRKPGSGAFMDRLYFMHWPLDPMIEAKATGLTPKALPTRKERTATPQAWGQWVLNMREWAKVNMPTLSVTPRATLAGLTALAIGETPEEVAHALVFRGADDEMIYKALSAVPLP